MTELELEYDLQTGRIDYSEAARLAGVSVSVVRQWKKRGHVNALTPLPGERGPRFAPIAVLRAEAVTRKNARRTLQKAS